MKVFYIAVLTAVLKERPPPSPPPQYKCPLQKRPQPEKRTRLSVHAVTNYLFIYLPL